ncbi:hypothetical protein PAMP_009138 [Pampus punctatissimus]
MLNTSLHNPNVKDKPSVERFISMNRGINDGGDLPEDLLRNLYESIKNEPFKIPEDDGNDLTHTFFNPDREGWLLKLGGMYTCSSQISPSLSSQSLIELVVFFLPTLLLSLWVVAGQSLGAFATLWAQLGDLMLCDHSAEQFDPLFSLRCGSHSL